MPQAAVIGYDHLQPLDDRYRRVKNPDGRFGADLHEIERDGLRNGIANLLHGRRFLRTQQEYGNASARGQRTRQFGKALQGPVLPGFAAAHGEAHIGGARRE